MRPPPARIWYDVAARIARQDAIPAFTDPQEKVLDYLWEFFPGLYLGTPQEIHPKETILYISREISKNVATSEKRERFDFLARGFELGNLSLPGWDVPLGPVYVKINREENYSRQDRFRPLGCAEHFIEAFRLSLESSDISDRKELLGQLLVSAILFGGLLSRKWLGPFQECVQRKGYYQEGSIVWFDMAERGGEAQSEQNGVGPADGMVRRLVPDHLTRLLLYRYHKQDEKESNKSAASDPWDNISAFLKGQSFSESLSPKSLNELFAWAFARYLTLLPHSLVGYASGKLPAQSLPIGPWLRTISGRAIPVLKSLPEDLYQNLGGVQKITVQSQAHKSDQQQLLSELLKTLRFNKKTSKSLRSRQQAFGTTGKISRQRARRTITIFMHRNRSRMSATLQLLLHWAQSLLTEKVSHLERRKKQSIRVKSVDRYLLSIGYALLRVAGDLPFHNLEPQDLGMVYEEVTLRLGKNGFGLQRLRQFHGFLQVYYGAQALEWDEMMGTGAKPQVSVNANLITPGVYNAVLKAFGWGNADLTRWQKLHIIAVMLLYRCGLRPSELQALRLKDVQGVTQFEILIRNSRLNSIKTNAGIRRVPVSYMLHKEELELFLAYHKMRLEEDRYFGGGLLLTHPVHFTGLLSDEELLEPIRKLLKSITKDENLRLYHLRHSFLTWAEIALMLGQSRNQVELPEIVPCQSEVDAIHHLFRHLYGNEAMGRKGMYLIAMLAGHASPETTCHHYCHLLDVMLSHHLNAPDASIQVSHRMVMALTGLQRSAAYDLLNVPVEFHPLHNVVLNEIPKFREALWHPLMVSAFSMKGPGNASSSTATLPSWEEAIGSILDNGKLATLRRAKGEWDFAAEMYEAIRVLDGRRMKTANKVVNCVCSNYNKRYGGIGIALQSQARLLTGFLSAEGIPKSHVVAIFHPAKRLTFVEAEEAKKKWANALGIAALRIPTGEFVSAKLGVRSMVTIKVTSKNTEKKARAPKMSPGFMVAMDLLCQSLCAQ